MTKKFTIMILALIILGGALGCDVTGGPKKTSWIKENLTFNEYIFNKRTTIFEERDVTSKPVGTFLKGSDVIVKRWNNDKSWALVRAASYDEKVYEGWVVGSHLTPKD